MSARVFNPAVMSELRKGLFGGEGGRATSSSVPARSAVQRVRRDLFGPVDHADIQDIVRRELGAQQARDADRWGFDFERGSPRRNGPGTARWEWKKVMPGERVALPYAHRRFTYLNTTTEASCEAAPATTSSDEKATTSESPVVSDNNNKQSHITDYMKSKKRAATVASEKLSPPSKQAKTSS